MTAMTIITTFAVAGACTFLLRAASTLVGSRLTDTAFQERLIPIATPAVLTTIVISALLVDERTIAVPRPAESVAVVAALLVARRSANIGWAPAVGLPIYWLASFASLG